jgi:hypothetical protein
VIPATAAESVLDPTVQVLLSIFGGAVVAMFAGLIVGLGQGRRDHRRWVREHRFEAFTTTITLLRRVAALREEMVDLVARIVSADESVLGADNQTNGNRNQDLLTMRTRLRDATARADALKADLLSASAPLVVLGPDSVDDALGEAAKAIGSDELLELRIAERGLIRAMRGTLKIRG